MAVADGSVHDAAVVSRAIARTNPGEQLNWRTARPELVDQPSRFALRRSAVASAKAEGRADCSWFDKLTTSGKERQRNCRSGLERAANARTRNQFPRRALMTT